MALISRIFPLTQCLLAVSIAAQAGLVDAGVAGAGASPSVNPVIGAAGVAGVPLSLFSAPLLSGNVNGLITAGVPIPTTAGANSVNPAQSLSEGSVEARTLGANNVEAGPV